MEPYPNKGEGMGTRTIVCDPLHSPAVRTYGDEATSRDVGGMRSCGHHCGHQLSPPHKVSGCTTPPGLC